MEIERFCEQMTKRLTEFKEYHKKHQKESGLSPELSALEWIKELLVYIGLGEILK